MTTQLHKPTCQSIWSACRSPNNAPYFSVLSVEGAYVYACRLWVVRRNSLWDILKLWNMNTSTIKFMNKIWHPYIIILNRHKFLWQICRTDRNIAPVRIASLSHHSLTLHRYKLNFDSETHLCHRWRSRSACSVLYLQHQDTRSGVRHGLVEVCRRVAERLVWDHHDEQSAQIHLPRSQ